MKTTVIDWARNYLAKMPPSIQGSRGSVDAFKAAIVPVRGFKLTDDQSLALLMEWNATCIPPWPERDLLAKIRSAHKDSHIPYGYLLKERDSRITHPARNPVGRTLPPPARPRTYTNEELAEKARQRAKWPILRPLSGIEVEGIAINRDCPRTAVEILSQNGLLMADDARPGCLALVQGTFRQYRRIDGTPMPCGEKSQNAQGSLAKGFFGGLSQFANLEPDDLIFIVEGAIGLLECVAIQWLCAPHARRWKFLAAHSAWSRFFYEPELLSAISNRRCRILPDAGKAGTAAAKAWRDEIRPVGCPMDFASMPAGFQDLRVLLAAGLDGLPAIRSLLAYPDAIKIGGAA